MAGRRPGGIRSGDLNEELGILLLKSFSVVAPVPRPEDVGIDAIATLLRDGPKNLLIAEDSFYVQLKSHSERTVYYDEHEVRWLESLRLPLFIGSVQKERATISLFTTHRMSQILLEGKHNAIRLHLDKHPDETGRIREVYIGPPVLEWDTTIFGNEEFASIAYSVIKPHVQAEQRNVTYRNIRYCEPIRWQTGKPPECQGGRMLFHSHVSPEDIVKVLETMSPPLSVIAARSLVTRDKSVLETVIKLIEYMRSNGVDADPNVYTNRSITTGIV